MARSSTTDPLEKFRFRVSVIAIPPTLTGAVDFTSAVETVSGLLANTEIKGLAQQTAVLARLGFSAVTLPKIDINEMTYRENIDGNRFTKYPGLTRYEPVVLKRGVTTSRDLYDWLRLVNDEILLLSSSQELTLNTTKPTRQSENFRKDVIIEVLDREGNSIKGWYLFNAWPKSYKPGDDLDANSETKLVEELTLTYEICLELEGGLAGFAKELAKNAIIENFDKFKLPFTR